MKTVWIVEAAHEASSEYEVEAVFSTEEAAANFSEEFARIHKAGFVRFSKHRLQEWWPRPQRDLKEGEAS